ncbi:MAG: hypothetical protein N2Z63_08575 [Thiobacillaceae bacterium]|nr:hypothetical protein [Sphingomonadaceae bacterium]MCX7673634.1 hypothetical protein [Thiobacillaceae bacterium]MDW8323019.1 hypothetical protein [Burkholderiales bacterium]
MALLLGAKARAVMLKAFSLLLILAGLVLGPVYWIYVVHFTGRVTQTLELKAGADGVWRTPVFRLEPSQAPLGLVLRASGDFAPNRPDDQPPRDHYRAVLYHGQAAGAPIGVELAASSVADSHPQFTQRLLLLARPQAGDYRLELIPAAAAQIRLDRVELEVRAQARSLDTRILAAGLIALAVGVLLKLM